MTGAREERIDGRQVGGRTPNKWTDRCAGGTDIDEPQVGGRTLDE